MTGWVILVDQPKDLPNAETPHKVITTSEYLARPRLFDMGRPKLVNLARSYAYQSKGYYASLLAEARGRTQPLCAPRRLPAGRRVQAPGLLRHCPRPALRIVRTDAVRLVPLPGARDQRRGRHVALDRPHPPA